MALIQSNTTYYNYDPFFVTDIDELQPAIMAIKEENSEVRFWKKNTLDSLYMNMQTKCNFRINQISAFC